MKATKQFKISTELDPELLKRTSNILQSDELLEYDQSNLSVIGLDQNKNSYYSNILTLDAFEDEHSRESGFLGSMGRESNHLSRDLLDSMGAEYKKQE